jgi:hypothetical protein
VRTKILSNGSLMQNAGMMPEEYFIDLSRAVLSRERAIANYSRCITSLMTALAPLSTVMILWTGAYPVRVMSTT